MRMRPILVILLAAAFPAVAASAQDDAGTGGDAPDSYAAAPLLGEGNWTGALSRADGDEADMYRVHVPPLHGMRVQASATRPAFIEVFDPDHELRAHLPITFTLIERPEPRLRIAADPQHDLTYDLALALVPLADVRVAGVRDVAIAPSEEHPLPNTWRRAQIDVSNQGLVAASKAVVWVEFSTAASSPRPLGNVTILDLGPGETRTVEIVWEASGAVGGGTLRAAAVCSCVDAEPGNNVRIAKTLFGVGADAFSVYTSHCATWSDARNTTARCGTGLGIFHNPIVVGRAGAGTERDLRAADPQAFARLYVLSWTPVAEADYGAGQARARVGAHSVTLP